MNKNMLIVLVGGAVIAILVAVLVQMSLGAGKKETAVAVEAPKTRIVVAAQDIPVGAVVGDKNMKWQDWPKDAVFEGAVVQVGAGEPSEVLKGRVLRNIAAGEPITRSALVAEVRGNFLAASLDDGMRAVAVNVKADAVAGGFVAPGDYVDVLLTYKSSIRVDSDDPGVEQVVEKNLNKLATETVLENVHVIAVDQTIDRGDGEDKVKVGKTVTLEVDRKGAEIIALSKEMGEISFALRKLGDAAVLDQKMPVTTDARVTRIYDEVSDEIEQHRKSAGQSLGVVKIYEGGAVQSVSVGH